VPVIAAVLGVVVLLAAVVFVAPPVPVTAPVNLVLDLEGPRFNGTAAVVTVSFMNYATNPAAFLVSLSANGTASVAVPMPTTSGPSGAVVVTPSGYPFRIDWGDSDQDGKLSMSDTFTITPLLSPPPCCLYESFYILRQPDGAMVGSLSFYGGLRVAPTVTFGSAVRGMATNVYIPVAWVSVATDPNYLRVDLEVDYNASAIIPMPLSNTAANLSVGGGEYVVAWYDNNYDAFLDEGDAFNVTLVNGAWPTSGTYMAFSLFWQDSTTLATATWNA